MTEAEIRALFAARLDVAVQVASPGDGSPEIAWGDTFVYLRTANGTPSKMPFVTIVTKDYPGFDEQSQLEPGQRYRLNVDAGSKEFAKTLGFSPRDLETNRARIDYAAVDRWLPHPAYGQVGWLSIVNPSRRSAPRVRALLEHALQRAVRRRPN